MHPLAQRFAISEWSGRQDLNLRPLLPKQVRYQAALLPDYGHRLMVVFQPVKDVGPGVGLRSQRFDPPI